MATLSTLRTAILLKLGSWTAHWDHELPRTGYGYRRGMTGHELYTSARAWWRLDIGRARRYAKAAAVHDGVVLGVWAIDAAGWRSWQDPSVGTSRVRWAFAGAPADPDVADLFVGGHIPRLRPDGRHTFGSGSPVGYWPR